MTKRIQEAATLTVDKATKKFRVCLITEGVGSSALFPREFFIAENAAPLAGALSFPNHPFDWEHPEHRDPMTAIGYIGEQVDIEEHDGKLGFYADYHPAESKPQVGEFLAEFGTRLGLSVFADSDGRNDPNTGKWIAESISSDDPYKSVDLVVAAGRGGKFEKIAESLGILPKASASAGEKEVIMEIADVEKVVATALTTFESKIIESLVAKLAPSMKEPVELEPAAVDKIVEARLADYDKAVGLISEAKLTESQTEAAKAIALKGESVEPYITEAKKVLAEALLLAGGTDDDDPKLGVKIVEAHLGGSGSKSDAWDPTVAGFGQVG